MVCRPHRDSRARTRPTDHGGARDRPGNPLSGSSANPPARHPGDRNRRRAPRRRPRRAARSGSSSSKPRHRPRRPNSDHHRPRRRRHPPIRRRRRGPGRTRLNPDRQHAGQRRRQPNGPLARPDPDRLRRPGQGHGQANAASGHAGLRPPCLSRPAPCLRGAPVHQLQHRHRRIRTGQPSPLAPHPLRAGSQRRAPASKLGRPTHVWTSIALTGAAMLGWHPELAWDVGFQLSFAGTAAIILLTPAIDRRITFMPGVLREPFAVTCAAQVGTVPMMATDFHLLSPVAPITNALVIPILPVLITAGLLIGALSAIPELARLVAIPVTGLLAYLEQVAFIFARIPAAAIPIAKFPTWMGIAYYFALAPAIATTQLFGRRRTLAAITTVLAPALIAATALGMWANSPPQAIVMGVGDGQAVLIRGPQGAILIDGGPSPARLKDELGAQLPPWQKKLDAVAITAPSLGHVGGFAGFDRAAAQVLIPDVQLTGSAWRTAALEATARGAAVRRLGAGRTITIAGFDLQVLAPEPRAPGDQVGAAYLALRIVAPSGRSFCDLSDLDLDAQTIAATRLRGTCTYLLLPAGGRSLLSADLARAALTPTTQLIASRGAGRLATGFPPNVLRTDQEGTITLAM